jgi:hypothetical protein
MTVGEIRVHLRYPWEKMDFGVAGVVGPGLSAVMSDIALAMVEA